MSELPKPPGTKLARPIAWPRKNARARDVINSGVPLARVHAAKAIDARSQSSHPIAASCNARDAVNRRTARRGILGVSTPTSDTTPSTRANAPTATKGKAMGNRAARTAASAQPINPEVNAVEIATTPSWRSAGSSTLGRYSQNRMAGPASGPSVRKLLHAKATAPKRHRSERRDLVWLNAMTSYRPITATLAAVSSAAAASQSGWSVRIASRKSRTRMSRSAVQDNVSTRPRTRNGPTGGKAQQPTKLTRARRHTRVGPGFGFNTP